MDAYIGTAKAPEDKYNLTWFLFLLLGIGVLFPWNAFISANDYFKEKYKPFPIEFTLPLIYNYPNMIFLLIVSKWGDKWPLRGRLLVGFAIEIFVFAIIPLQDALPEKIISAKTSLALVLAMASICGLCAALLIGTLFGFAAMFPPHYMTAVMSGNGVAGIIIFAMKSAMKLGFGDNAPGPQRSSITYFSAAGGVILCCFIALVFMPRLKFVRYHLEQNSRKSKALAGNPDSINDGTLLLSPGVQRETPFIRLLSQFWSQAANVFWVFFVTLSLFPGLLFNIVPNSQKLAPWLGVLLVGTFQVGDFVGRTLPRFVTSVKPDGEVSVLVPRRWNWILTILHTVFFPLIIILVVPLNNAYLTNNAWAFVIVGLFSISNGFSGTIPMIYGPSSVEPKDAGRVGTIMAVFLNLGIFLGSHMAFLMLWSVSPTKLTGIFKH
jgi:equilibrative nucleoside transporter 1/2/3